MLISKISWQETNPFLCRGQHGCCQGASGQIREAFMWFPTQQPHPQHGCPTRNHNLRPWRGFETHLAATVPPVQPESRRDGTYKAHAGQDTDSPCPGAPARPRRHRGRLGPAPAACSRTPDPGSAGCQPRSSSGTAHGLLAHRRAAARHARGPAASSSGFLGTAAGRGRAHAARAGRHRGGARGSPRSSP